MVKQVVAYVCCICSAYLCVHLWWAPSVLRQHVDPRPACSPSPPLSPHARYLCPRAWTWTSGSTRPPSNASAWTLTSQRTLQRCCGGGCRKDDTGTLLYILAFVVLCSQRVSLTTCTHAHPHGVLINQRAVFAWVLEWSHPSIDVERPPNLLDHLFVGGPAQLLGRRG